MTLFTLLLLLTLLVGAALGFGLRAYLAGIEKEASALLGDVHARLTALEQFMGLVKAVSVADPAPAATPAAAPASPASAPAPPPAAPAP